MFVNKLAKWHCVYGELTIFVSLNKKRKKRLSHMWETKALTSIRFSLIESLDIAEYIDEKQVPGQTAQIHVAPSMHKTFL